MTLLAQIEQLDARTDSMGLEEEEWAQRYFLEDPLLQIVREEEEYCIKGVGPSGRSRGTSIRPISMMWLTAGVEGTPRQCPSYGA
jgi:hypothetical protein